MVGEVGPTSSSKWDCQRIWGSWCENGTMNEHGETLSSSFFFSWFSSTHFFCFICSSLLRMLLFKMACFRTCQISKQSCSPSLLEASFVGASFFFFLFLLLACFNFSLLQSPWGTSVPPTCCMMQQQHDDDALHCKLSQLHICAHLHGFQSFLHSFFFFFFSQRCYNCIWWISSSSLLLVCLQIGTNNNNSDFFITLILKLQETLKQMAAAATQLQQLHRAALDQWWQFCCCSDGQLLQNNY
jgi:hypothetical protein